MDSKNIKSLFGDRFATPNNEPVPQVVDFLKDLLARAEKGDVRAVAVAFIRGNNNSSLGWELDGGREIIRSLHSAIICLANKYVNSKLFIDAPVSDDDEIAR